MPRRSWRIARQPRALASETQRSILPPMLPAILTVSLSVLVGASLALFGIMERRKLAASIDAFALFASLAVVLGHLLPHSITALGLWAIVPFALALGLPTLLERALDRRGGHAGHGAALELSYLGLLVHQFGDGLGLGVFSSGAHEGHLHLDLMLGIGAHTVPIATLMTRAYLHQRGARAAAIRTVGLVLAGVFGVAFAHRLPADLLSKADPWLSAAIGGLLLHIVLHDPRSPSERGAPSRAAEIFALAFGLALLFLGGGYDHTHGTDEPGATIGASILQLLFVLSGPLVVGIVTLEAIRRFFPRRAETLRHQLESRGLPAAGFFLVALVLSALLPPLHALGAIGGIGLASRLGERLRLRARGGGAHASRSLGAQLFIGILLAAYLMLVELSRPYAFALTGVIALAFPRAPLAFLPSGFAFALGSVELGSTSLRHFIFEAPGNRFFQAESTAGTGPLLFGLALTLSVDFPALLRSRSPRLIFAFFYALLLGQLASLIAPALPWSPPELASIAQYIFSALLLVLFFAQLLRSGIRALLDEVFGGEKCGAHAEH